MLDTEADSWDWALENIERWLSQGRVHPALLLEWRQCLMEARSEAGKRTSLLNALREPPADAHQYQLRSCSPFVGGPFQTSTLAAVLAA